jgi:hypothetical protein
VTAATDSVVLASAAAGVDTSQASLGYVWRDSRWQLVHVFGGQQLATTPAPAAAATAPVAAGGGPPMKR